MKLMNQMRKGATFIEYAMLAGLIAIIVAAAAWAFGDKITGLFSATGDKTCQASSLVKQVSFGKKSS